MQVSSYRAPLFAFLMILAPAVASAGNGVAVYAGGSFSTGNASGQTIAVTGAPISGSKATLSFSCPITDYTSGTYSLSWTCAAGTVSVTSPDHSMIFTGSLISGTMSFSSSGGGKGGRVVGNYQFGGSFSGKITSAGVTQYAYGSLSQSVQTSGTIGSAGAPVTAGSLGWNSGYSPILIADASTSRLLIGDNISGANLEVASSPGSGVWQTNTVSGLAQDANQRIYATDSGLDRVDRINDATGAGWATLGGPGAGVMQFSKPHGIAIDSLGRVWIADTGNHRIVRFNDMSGAQWTTFGSPGAGTRQFNSPTSIAFDPQGRVYVADTGNNRIVRFDDISGAGWTTLEQVSVGSVPYLLTGPSSLAIDRSGRIYVGLADGYLLGFVDTTGAGGTVSYWSGPITALSVDSSGTLFVASALAPGLAQVLDATGSGYFAAPASAANLKISALLALYSPQPTPGAAMFTPDAFTFAGQNIGTQSPAQSTAVINLGATPLTFTSIHSPADYKVINGCPYSLAPGASCSGSVQFTPRTTGWRNTNVTIGMSGARSTKAVLLSGLGTAPQASLLPGALSFDPQRSSTASSTQTVTLTNGGTGPLTIQSVVASAGFQQTSNCSGVIPPTGGCTLQVAFSPTGTGPFIGKLTISDDAVAGGAQQTVTLSGTGSSTAPVFTLSPESVLFAAQQVQTTSIDQIVTLANASGATVSLGAPTYSSSFGGMTRCGASLANGASCTYSVHFQPSGTGAVTGAIKIPITGMPALSVNLAGTGVVSGSPALLSVAPASVAFGPVAIGDTSTVILTAVNPSGLPAGISSVYLAGDSAFAISSNSCQSVLAGKTSCAVAITFSPVPTSSYVNGGTLTFVESTGAATQISISGFAAAASTTNVVLQSR